MRYAFVIGIIVWTGCSAEGLRADGSDAFGGAGPQTNAAGSTGSTGSAGTTGSGGSTSDYVIPMGGSGGSGGSETSTIQDAGPQIEDGNTCGSVTTKADVEVIKKPGNLMVLFDRSGSMSDVWGSVPKYQAAGEALIAGLTPLQASLIIGGIFFPSLPTGGAVCDVTDFMQWLPGGACLTQAAGSCEVTDIAAADQISFRSGAEFIAEVPNQWLLMGAMGTPLGNAVIQADAAISSSTFDGTVAALIMTDGEPNCGTVPEDVISTVTKWNTAGIKSYVVGLPGSDNATNFLNELAVAGGTNTFISPDDPTALQNEVSTIVTDTIKSGLKSCTINLQQNTDADLANLHLIVVENGVEGEVLKTFGGGGWNVSADGLVATLEGKLCDDAKNGRFESVRFDFGCVKVPVIIK
jgi:hypothetical protein